MNLNKRVAFYTLGCKVNQYETESIKNSLLQMGYTETPFDKEADIYIVNSCTVTNIADRKTRNMLRRAKNISPTSTVIITGCYAQTNSEDLLNMEEIDYVVGNTNKKSLADFISKLENEKNLSRLISSDIFKEKDYMEYDFATFREMNRAYVKIQDGCNNFCSYCKIPFARGKSRSREKENILQEIRNLVGEGFKEIILIGINLGAYGEDLNKKITFEDLLREICEIPNLQRVRLGSIYPDRISDEFINLFKEYKNLMPHLHISLQSCDDTILHKMRRKYGADLIIERLNKLKNEIKDMEYTADVIVGFPTETDEMFNNTYNVIKQINFTNLHIFPYSDRENTEASRLNNKISGEIKKKRTQILDELRKEMYLKARQKYIGKELEILVEDENGGYSQNYIKIKLNNHKVNDIVKMKIDREMLVGCEKE